MKLDLPQIVYSSGVMNGHPEDYAIKACSMNIELDERRIVLAHSSAGYGNIIPHKECAGIMFYKIKDSDRHAFGVKTVNGKDAYGRDKYFCHTILLEPEQLDAVGYDPFVFLPSVLNETREMEEKKFTSSDTTNFPQLTLELNKEDVMNFPTLLGKTILDIDKYYRIFDIFMHTAMETEDVILFPIRNEDEENSERLNSRMRLFLSALPLEKRKSLSFSTYETSPFRPSYDIMCVHPKARRTVSAPPRGYTLIENTADHPDMLVPYTRYLGSKKKANSIDIDGLLKKIDSRTETIVEKVLRERKII